MALKGVRGLTTAASIWTAAGIGIAAGLGMEATAVLSTAIVLFVLAIVPVFAKHSKEVPAEFPEQNESPPSSKS